MYKKIITLFLITTMVLSFGFTTYASPKMMPDGEYFDASYYATRYPDVVAILGTSEEALYQHYVTFGKAEGRKGNPSAEEISQMNAQGVVTIVNEERSKVGLCGVTLTSELNKCAFQRAKEMAENNYFAHTRPNGEFCFTVLDQFGVYYDSAGENIALGYSSPEAVMNGWMNSSGHRANILKSNYNKMGIGFYDGYWAQLFTD